MSEFIDEIRPVLVGAIAKAVNVDEASITDETQPFDELGVKSGQLVAIIGALEDETDIEIPFMQFRRNKTVGEMLAYVEELSEE